MPTYSFHCQKCDSDFESFSKVFRKEPIGEIIPDYDCKVCLDRGGVKRIWPDDLDISLVVGEFKDRQAKQDEDHRKKAKDPDRAMKIRKKEFGSDNVNVKKSELAKREHKIQKKIIPHSQGVSQDMDKKEFIKAAAKNPKAFKAAQEALKKAGKPT